MALVGDIIMEMRSLGPDLPQTLNAPGSEMTVLQTPVPPTSMPLGTYFVVLTYLNQWGQTTGSTESSGIVVDGGDTIQVNGTLPPGVTALGVYYGIGAGNETQFQTFTTLPAVITTTGSAGSPPVRSTAYLPDTDGAFVSAGVAFRWLNEALKKAALVTGGIQDWGGATSVANQPNYRPSTGVWRKFDHCWYDGWELEQGNKAEIFRNRQITASISRIFAMDVNSSQQVIELYYIPSRSGAVTTTSANFNAGDVTVSLVSTVGFQGPPFGLVQIGSEVCFFASVQGGTLTGLTRGLSGTSSPTQLASGATVREMNILWNGFRMPNVYAVGNSLLTLDVPQGWESILPKYLLAKFREAEQSRQEAASLFKEFDGEFKTLAYANRQLAGPRQARIFDSFGFRGVIPASAGGGLIIR